MKKGLLERLENLEAKETMILPLIWLFSNKTEAEALADYNKEHNTDFKEAHYIVVYPEYFRHDHILFYDKNEKIINGLIIKGYTLDSIYEKYFVDRNSIIEDNK